MRVCYLGALTNFFYTINFNFPNNILQIETLNYLKLLVKIKSSQNSHHNVPIDRKGVQQRLI